MGWLSKRALSIRESATLLMSKKAQEMRSQGVDVMNLSVGAPDFNTPEHICASAQAVIASKKYFSYPPVAGYADVRACVAEKLRKENGISGAQADSVLISTGAKQSVANVFSAILNEGDEVLMHAPYWVSYPDICEIYGGVPKVLYGGIDSHYKPSAEALSRAISSKTKAFIFSSPSNPTGAVLSEKEIEAWVEVLSQHPDILIISDEIYEHIHYDCVPVSIGRYASMSNRTITINGLSKSYAMTGWRLGYMHGPLDIIHACEKIQGQCTSGANSISQRMLITALEGSKSEIDLMVNAYRKRRDYVLSRLSKIEGLRVDKPEGAFYVFPDISAYIGRRSSSGLEIEDVDGLAMYLLSHARVSTVSGRAFGDGHGLRISYAASMETLAVAMDRIESALGELE